MGEKMIVRTEKDYKVSRWSGGDTTELYLYPEDGDYKSATTPSGLKIQRTSMNGRTPSYAISFPIPSIWGIA